MSDPHPIMMMLLEHSSFVGPAETVESNIQPIDAQLNWGVGNYAILAMANTPLERDFVIAKGLDPEKHAEEFPDWEERMAGLGGDGWGSHVLCQLFSRADPELTRGWVGRLKLFPISSYRYRQVRKWLKDGWPDDLPEWVEEVYLKWTDELALQAPDVVPRVVICPNCGSRHVGLKVTRTIEYTAKVGTVEIEGVVHYLPISSVEESSTHIAVLQCADCPSFADLEDAEWNIPDVTN